MRGGTTPRFWYACLDAPARERSPNHRRVPEKSTPLRTHACHAEGGLGPLESPTGGHGPCAAFNPAGLGGEAPPGARWLPNPPLTSPRDGLWVGGSPGQCGAVAARPVKILLGSGDPSLSHLWWSPAALARQAPPHVHCTVRLTQMRWSLKFGCSDLWMHGEDIGCRLESCRAGRTTQTSRWCIRGCDGGVVVFESAPVCGHTDRPTYGAPAQQQHSSFSLGLATSMA